MVIMYGKTISTIFRLLLLLHCYSQVATIFRWISGYFANFFLLKCLPSNATRKSRVKTVVGKLQSLILLGTRREAPLEHFIAPDVPTSQQRLTMTWNTTYLWNIQECEQKTLTSVKNVWRNSLAFIRYENTGTVNMEFW